MRIITLVFCLIALTAPCHAAQKQQLKHPDLTSLAKKCRQIVGPELPEATDGRSHEGQLNVQRFSDCLMGR
jgi:hypothetical protein